MKPEDEGILYEPSDRERASTTIIVVLLFLGTACGSLAGVLLWLR